MTLRPFQRLRYVDVPKQPRVPHAYHRAEARDVHVPSSVFGNVRVHVRVMGSGPPLLLVHGLMTSSYSFRYVLEPLAKHFRVYAVDLPGSGRSDKPLTAQFTARNFGVFLAELQRELGIRGCAVMGNSLGGYIAMHLALHDPAAVSRLVVNHAPGIPESRFTALKVLLSSGLVRGAFRRLVQRDVRQWIFRNVRYQDETLKSMEELDEFGAPLVTDDGMGCFIKMLRETMDPLGFEEFVRELGREVFPVPMLLVYARQDPMIPARVGKEIHRLARGSKLEWLEGSSHYSHVDNPQKMVDTVVRFLGEGEVLREKSSNC
jgi:pimeloyl-ACP methyl ester carboxylesterase